MIYKHVITYESDREINIGDVFYHIEDGETHHFREPCKVCNDEKKLTVNGVEFKCPVCGTSKSHCSVTEYVVRRYRVYGFSDEVDNEDWKPSDRHRKTIYLYRKVGAGHSYFNSGFRERKVGLNNFVDYLNGARCEGVEKLFDWVFFSDYKTAVKTAKELTEKELEKLQEYNKYYGKNFEFVPACENDKPSK